MKMKRAIVVVATVLALLTATSSRPQPARALSQDAEITIIAASAVVGIMVGAALLTWVLRDEPSIMPVAGNYELPDRFDRGADVRFGPACARSTGNPLSICW